MFPKLPILVSIFLIVLADLVTCVTWSWYDIRDNQFDSELTGRAGRSSSSPAIQKCSAFCMDATKCQSSGCYYDLATLHCYQNKAIATRDKVRYKGYSPPSKEESKCVNIGGGAVTGEYGYVFDSDPQTSKLVKKQRVSTGAWIQGAESGDQNVFRTARLHIFLPLQYNLKFVGDAYYLLRLMFAEVQGKRRNFNVILNNAYTLKSNFDVGSAVGKNKAYNLFLTIKSQNGNSQMVYHGSTTNTGGGLANLNIKKNGLFKTGILNGFCGIRFPPCTEHCYSPKACNAKKGCYYDYKISHCVQNAFKPAPPPPPPTTPKPTPKPTTTTTTLTPPTTTTTTTTTESPFDIMCRGIGTVRDACESKGCTFCCNTLSCTGTVTSDCYNGGCMGDCFRPNDCKSKPNHCIYDYSSGRCTDCTHVKLQLAFVVSVSSKAVIQNFHRISTITTDLKRIFRDPEFAVTTFTDWGDNDPDSCFKVAQPFTTDERKIVQVAATLKHLKNDNTKSGSTALVWTSADNSLGWGRHSNYSDGRQIVRLMILFDNQFIDGDDGFMTNSKGRNPSKGDGSDTCGKSLPVTDQLFKDVLLRDGMSVMGVFTKDEDPMVKEKWEEFFESAEDLPNYSLFGTRPNPDVFNYVQSFVAGQNVNC